MTFQLTLPKAYLPKDEGRLMLVAWWLAVAEEAVKEELEK